MRKSPFNDRDKLNKKERLFDYLEKFQGKVMSMKTPGEYLPILVCTVMMCTCPLNISCLITW